MPIDFQIEIETLKGYLKSTIAKNLPVITDSFTIDPAEGPVYITGYDLENATLTASPETDGRWTNLLDYQGSTPHVTVGATQLMTKKLRPQFTLLMGVFYSTVKQLREANFSEPAKQSFLLVVNFVLDAWADFNGSLSIAPELKDFSGQSMLSPAQQQKLQNTVAALTIPVNLTPALGSNDLVKPPRFLNAGMTLSQDNSFVIIRFEYERPNPQIWNSFYTGQMPSVLGDQQWAVLISQELLTGPINDMVSNGLADNQNISVTAWPNIYWQPMQVFGEMAIPALGGLFSGIVSNACPGVDLHFTVDCFAVLSVPETNKLRMTLDLEVHTRLGDDVACAAEAALGWGILGLALASNIGNKGWGIYWTGLTLGPVFGFASTLAFLNSSGALLEFSDVDKDLPKEFTKVSDTEYVATFDLSSISKILGGMTLTTAGATDDALVLAGTLTVDQVTQGSLSTWLDHGFEEWDDEDPCLPLSFKTSAVIGVGDQPPKHTVPVKFAGPFVQVPNSPLLKSIDPYSSHLNWVPPGHGFPGHIKIALQDEDIDPAFDMASYPCQLLLLSTVGARWMTVPAPPPKPQLPAPGSPADIERKLWQALHCGPAGGAWGAAGGFNPKWNIDPPIEGIDYVRHWGLTISGLQPNDQVGAYKGESLLAFGQANRSGRLGLSFFDKGIVGAVRLELGSEEPRPNATVKMRQTLLAPVARVSVSGEFRTLQFVGEGGTLMLKVQSLDGVISYRIRGRGATIRTRPNQACMPPSPIAEFGKYVARYEEAAGAVQLYRLVETRTYLNGTVARGS